MHRFAVPLLIIVSGFGLALTASARAANDAPGPIVAIAAGTAPQSRAEGAQAIDDALAAALVGAIATRFDEQRIDVKLDHVDSTMAGFLQRDLRGNARLKIGRDGTWIPVSFSALYDTSNGTVGFPSLVLGADAPGQVLPADDHITRQLATEVDARLGSEFASQDVRFKIDQARVVHVGNRFLRLDANGVADFGVEGTTTAIINALYDPGTGRWIHLNYELGPAANRSDAEAIPETVAVR